jgi:archaemetzincin
MNSQHITLLTFGYFDKGLLEEVAGAVSREFNYPVICRDIHIDLGEFYDAGRRQYNGDKVLKTVVSKHEYDSIKTIGLLNIDLFIPILTYIFGQAQLGGSAGIASMYRLSNELYGLKHDVGLQKERFIKEVIHELGHAFGLLHCHDVICVMRSGSYVEDIDQKSKDFCLRCRSLMDHETNPV